MVLANPDESEANLIGELPLKDEVANGFCLRKRLAIRPGRNVAEGVEP
jgi:hypothetical protein